MTRSETLTMGRAEVLIPGDVVSIEGDCEVVGWDDLV